MAIPAAAFSVRSLGMGNIYSPAATDPAGLFYNPAYLARNDAIRLSGESLLAGAVPKDCLALSIGDLGVGRAGYDQGGLLFVGHGFNTYSFFRLGIGVRFLNGKKDFDLGFDADLNRNWALSAAVQNTDGAILPADYNLNLAYHTEDRDRSVVVARDSLGKIGLGYEQQFLPRAFFRFGLAGERPTLGLTYPLNRYIDLDLAGDWDRGGGRVLFGLNVFRNTENKKINSNRSLNFGPAIVGEDKFAVIEGYNLHYVDAGGGYPFVLIGGGIHYTHHWDPYMAELAAQYRVINIDHLGAGESDKPNYFFGYTTEEQAEIVNALLDQIGIKEAYLLGYCYGGSVAMYLAGKYPEKYKKVVAIEGFVVGLNNIPIEGNTELRRQAVTLRHDVEYLGAYLLRDFVCASYRLDYPYFNEKMWFQVNRSILYIDIGEKVKGMKASLLYYAGTKSWAKDFLAPTKEFVRKNVKDLEYIEIEGAGHDVDRYDQKEFMRRLLAFLKQ
ncbi:MAG: alpha/beta hydrolase [Candidatus Margulisiibacteriota bacterium]